MLKRYSIHLIVQFVMLIVAATIVFIPAITIMGGIGGTAIGVAPEFTFRLVNGIVCPEGTLEYYSVQRSYHEPGESEPHVECIRPDGHRENVLIPAIFSVLGFTFLTAFSGFLLITFIPLSAVAFILTRKIISGLENKSGSSP